MLVIMGKMYLLHANVKSSRQRKKEIMSVSPSEKKRSKYSGAHQVLFRVSLKSDAAYVVPPLKNRITYTNTCLGRTFYIEKIPNKDTTLLFMLFCLIYNANNSIC